MDNAIGDIQIIEVLKHKYKYLYNSVPTSDAEVQSLYSIVKNGINSDQLQDIYVTPDIIAQCIKRLKRRVTVIMVLNQLFDYVIMHTCNDYLYTSDMQCGFKPQQSTTMFSLVYHEIINHYVSNNSNVYGCLLDASKDFDKVHYGKLLYILFNRKDPFCIIQLLMASSERQRSLVMWNFHVSDYFQSLMGLSREW